MITNAPELGTTWAQLPPPPSTAMVAPSPVDPVSLRHKVTNSAAGRLRSRRHSDGERLGDQHGPLVHGIRRRRRERTSQQRGAYQRAERPIRAEWVLRSVLSLTWFVLASWSSTSGETCVNRYSANSIRFW
jgi:hypothetical protein